MNALKVIAMLALLGACTAEIPDKVITVTGEIRPDKLGTTLSHEHVLVDFTGAELHGNTNYDTDSAFRVILPHVTEIFNLGVKTFVDCTPKYLGRNPLLLKRLSEETGMNFITNTGFYGAMDNKYIPEPVLNMPAEAIAAFWIAEYKQIYGDPFQWPVIYKANRAQIKDPDLIFPDQNFTIPREPDLTDDMKSEAIKFAKRRGAWSLHDGK